MVFFQQYFREIIHNRLVLAVALAVVLDTLLGFLRSIRTRKFNSSFGIDGAIRKTAIIISVLILMFADYLMGLNLIEFVSEEVREAVNLEKVGMGEFFCILYILYEATSILKNWYMIGLPVPKSAKPWLKKLLTEMTDEMPKMETEMETKTKENDKEGMENERN